MDWQFANFFYVYQTSFIFPGFFDYVKRNIRMDKIIFNLSLSNSQLSGYRDNLYSAINHLINQHMFV
ncbi:hypothetical protein BRO54_3130 [Geobacillus proteiniphilus]|uniref:Uncharacterized protein n=1 Tax=Geobacillus proteiniphilus TaxID=860353 RepID=A0A1Q5SQ15_9BACL|nr:hypothetical protein BRO54_3130 [Geobacillus proteiniphilus]